MRFRRQTPPTGSRPDRSRADFPAKPPATQHGQPAAQEPQPPGPIAGRKLVNTRRWLVFGAHVLASASLYAILIADPDVLTGEFKAGLIGAIVRDIWANLNKIYNFFLPQND